MNKMHFGSGVLLSLCVIFSANAEDEMVTRARSDAEMKTMAAEMNAACGTAVQVSIDWDSFAKSDWQDYSIPSYCGSPLETLTDFCRAEKGNSKAFIQKKVKEVACYYGGEGLRDLQVSDGTIKSIVDFQAPNLADFTRAALLKRL